MSNFVPGNYDLRTALIFCYHLKKTAAESHRMLVEAYSEHALGKSQCFEWFKKFRSGNFDARNEERGRPPKKFQDSELQALLDEDDAQTQQQLADQLNVTREAVLFHDCLDSCNCLPLMNKNIRGRIETIIGTTGTSRIVQLRSDEARALTKSLDTNFFNRQLVPTDMNDKNETRNNILWTVPMDLWIFTQNNMIVLRVLLIFYCECYSGYRSLPDFQEN